MDQPQQPVPDLPAAGQPVGNPADANPAQKSAVSAPRFSTASTDKKRRKVKRNPDPIGFEEWQPTDREFYQQVTLMLRNWKATERQCSAIRRPITFWENLKLQKRANMTIYKTELEAYKKTLKDFVRIPETETVDLN
uniref:Uncharacterized protein n=1 Tax=Panagrolaimus sp. JU765 TaxID=591449 RepID=A0AC34PXS9_9BILA